MAFAIALILLVVASVLFHYLSPWYLTPVASNWGNIDTTIDITFWVTGFVFVVVNLFMAYAVIRFRYRKDRRSDYEPENKKLEWWLTGITTVGVAAMLAPGLFVWADIVTPPKEASVVEAMGQQWYWNFRYPGKDGVLGSVASKNVTDENPFGMDRNDPNGQDDVLVAGSKMHLPIGKPVKMLLRSKDVLHNFSVAQFRVKMDLVPGLVTSIWFTPTRVGRFDLLCEELCGLAHFTMRGHVVVEEEDAYQTWLKSNRTFAQTMAETPGDPIAGQSQYAVCAACHGAQGEGNLALHAPKLSGQGAWYLKRQLGYFKTGVRGSHEQDLFGKQMAPMAQTLADDAAINNVVAYIQTLPDNPSPATVQGDVGKGRGLFTACTACHGSAGQGIQALNAPRQAGMSDWYLVTQLKNFRDSIRGSHTADHYGQQMTLMTTSLDDQEIDDIASYINTLR